jgi:16S rRNA (adenine1518-N6/adenine1519-N6)-dimethyltransferase
MQTKPAAVHAPRKRFGQNFLQDTNVVERIVASINPKSGERFVEIGPGLGALTLPLLRRLDYMDVVEIDRDIVAHLRMCPAADRLTIHEGDALEFDFAALGQSLRLIGNLPYNISTPLLFHLTTMAHCVRDAHFMLQREVVERMCALPGTRQYGRLSVMLQYRWRIETLFEVGPGAFRPAPKVWSSVARMGPQDAAKRIARIAGAGRFRNSRHRFDGASRDAWRCRFRSPFQFHCRRQAMNSGIKRLCAG